MINIYSYFLGVGKKHFYILSQEQKYRAEYSIFSTTLFTHVILQSHNVDAYMSHMSEVYKVLNDLGQ